MKRTMLIASLAAMSISSSAMALTEGPPRAVVVSGRPAGIASFFLAGNIGGPVGACSYYMDWQSPFSPAGSAACNVAETKALGATSCLGNRFSDVPTILTSAPGCQGFDQYGLLEDVTLTLGESFTGAPISGLALFSQFPFLPQSIIIN